MKQAKIILQQLDAAEVVAIEGLTKLVAWLAPFVTGVLIADALHALNYTWPVAILYAFTVEALAVAFISTAAFFFSEWWGRLPAVGAFAVAAVCVIAYVVIALPVVTIIKAAPDLGWVVPAGGVVLSLLSGVIVAIRSNWTKYAITHATDPTRPTRRRASVRKRPTEQSPEERAVNRDRANAARTPTQADYDEAARLKAEEGFTWNEVGERIGRSSSTAKRWAALASEPAEESIEILPQRNVSISSNGVHND